MNEVTLRLPNGMEVRGTAEQVSMVAKTFGVGVDDGIHYNSSSRGLVRISEMDTKHIKNALRKMYQAWAASLDTNLPTPEFRKVLSTGPATDLTMLGLANELKRRV